MRTLALTLVALLIAVASAAEAPIQKIWQDYQSKLPKLEYKITSDTVVTSDVIPQVPLRRVEVTFVSQYVQGNKPLTHHAVIYVPQNVPPEKRGKVVIVGSVVWPFLESFKVNYAESIASLLGYPTMILPNPGETPDRPNREWSIRYWLNLPRDKHSILTNYYFRLAIPYLRGMDVLADVLGIPRSDIRAVIGGHSKRAPSAYNAAAIDPQRMAGVVFMGMEGQWGRRIGGKYEPISPLFNANAGFVRCPSIYLGATNEDGYSMFNVTHNQSLLKHPWTVSMVPNYRHAAESPQQFLVWQMCVAHCLGDRPVAKVWDATQEITDKGIYFRVHVKDPNKIVQVRAWYAYCDDVPLWRDIMWYPVVMYQQNGTTLWQGYERGKTPDAWMAEVEDVGDGVHGYVTSCPVNITGLPVKERKSRGSRSRNWNEK